MRDSSYKPPLYNEFISPLAPSLKFWFNRGPPRKLSETYDIKTPLVELRIVIRC